jgi:hypothetical protein
METTTLNGSGTAQTRNGSVAMLSIEEQENLFFDLVREIYRRNAGEGIIPLVNRKGEWLGNLVSPEQPAAAADRVFAEMPPQTRRAIMKPLLDFDFDDTLTDEEVTNLLKPDGRS